jgi:hypothetical protein
MKQLTLATVGFERYAKTPRRGVSGRDGAGCAVAGAVRTDRAVLAGATAARRSAG